MEATSIKEYERLDQYYWWFVGRRKILLSLLKRFFGKKHIQILDWGCGPGGNYKILSQFGSVTNVDASEEAILACKSKEIINIQLAATLQEFKPQTKFDLDTNFDVLEHIEEDSTFMRDVKNILVPNGYMLVTVPAYQFLWTKLDQVLGHKRRYTKGELIRKFENSGYEIVFASYFVFILSPAFIMYRLIEKCINLVIKKEKNTLNDSVIEFPRLINLVFSLTFSVEAFLMKYISLPFGTSIVVLARRK